MKKLLAGLILLVPMMLNASVIDKNSPWGVCVWNYIAPGKTIDALMDSVVSLGCSWIRLTEFGGDVI